MGTIPITMYHHIKTIITTTIMGMVIDIHIHMEVEDILIPIIDAKCLLLNT
jgi:hypothetical protein